MIFSLKSAARFLLVMLRYPRAGASLAMRFLNILPVFKRSIQYRQDRYRTKQQLKQSEQSIGHALGDRHVVGSLFGKRVFNLKLAEGAEATADQFFLNRPVDDAVRLISLARPFVEIRSEDFIFDPGCGAGRHLYYLADKYGCDAIGVDIYEPAIEVAETANWDSKIRFYARSSLESGLLDAILPHGCDFVFINSWLNHVKDYPGYRQFADEIVRKCRFLMVITTAKDNLETLFDKPDVIFNEERGGTQFALIRGNRTAPSQKEIHP